MNFINMLLQWWRSQPPTFPEEKPCTGLGEPGTPGTFPVAIWEGHDPVITDSFERPGPGAKRNGKGHWGGDIALRRPKSGKVRRPEYVKHFFCPNDKVPALNVFPGIVKSVKNSKKHGRVVKVAHGTRHISVHRHLSRTDVVAGQVVAEGTALGILGHAPSAGDKGFNHDHFEIWDMTLPGPKNSRAAHAVDPGPWLKHWTKRTKD